MKNAVPQITARQTGKKYHRVQIPSRDTLQKERKDFQICMEKDAGALSGDDIGGCFKRSISPPSAQSRSSLIPHDEFAFNIKIVR
jgi:hypothetical protein